MTTRLTSGGWLLLGCALMASCAQTLATSGQVSVTAEAVCALRAVAAQHPDPKVRNPDYLAEKFVSEIFWRTAGYRSNPGRARHNPNYFWVNARTRHMDALLVEALSQGATQVVNLGAGFDSRAYRFRERFPRARFFELDLPATIAAKRERVVKIFGAVPDRVALVATDFNTRPLDAVLRDAGYDRTQQTFFVWEGVTMYLPEAANRSTLQFIRSGSASGSSVVYDYVLDGALRPDGGGIYGAKTTAAYVASVGEPLLTGWSQSQAAAFATREGLVVVSDLGPAELTARYLTGSDGQPDGMMGEFQRIIHARVPEGGRTVRPHRNTALMAPSALRAGGNPVAGAVWMIASTTSVCDRPMFSADWPNFATCSGRRNAVNAATATSARWRRSRPERNQISP